MWGIVQIGQKKYRHRIIKVTYSGPTEDPILNIVNEEGLYCTCPSINVQGIYPYGA